MIGESSQRQDPFPLSVGLLRRKPIGKGARARERRRKRERKEEVREECIRGVKALAGGGLLDPWTVYPEVDRPPGVTRDRVVQFIHSAADRAIRHGFNPQADTLMPSKEGSYFCLEEKGCVFLDPDLVLLPPEGVAGQAEFLELSPERIRTFYEEEDKIVRKDQARPPKPFVGVAAGRYQDLIKKLVENGSVALQAARPKVVNGVFAVPKDTSNHRLIIDARPANAMLVDPPPVSLPNPGHLASLSFQDNGPLFVAKSDMDNFYHRLRMPGYLHQYFGLPPARSEEGKRWPVVQVLPMGWSHSVYIGQQIHEFSVREAGLSLETSFQHSNCVEVCCMRHGEYIDDFLALGSDQTPLRETLDKVIEVGKKRALPAKDSKRVAPGNASETVVLGVEISEWGLTQPIPERLFMLSNLILQILQFRTWNRKQLERLLGGWAWMLLLRRPLFSVLEAVYEGKIGESETFTPSRRMKQELFTVCALGPFVYADLKRPYSATIIATDASTRGGGLTYSEIDPTVIEALRVGTKKSVNLRDPLAGKQQSRTSGNGRSRHIFWKKRQSKWSFWD